MSEPEAGLGDLFRDEATQRLDEMDSALLMIESGDADASALDSLFRHAHTIKGAAGMLGYDDISALAHAAEDLLAEAREADVFPPELVAPLLRATGALRARVTSGPSSDVMDDLAAHTAPPRAPPQPAAANAAPPAGAARAEHGESKATAEHALRVPAAKIDHLLDVAGEIIQHRRSLVHALGKESELPQEVADAFGAGQRMLDDLRDTAVGMRTLPLGSITGPLPRAVRDLSRAAGKDVEFIVRGADTELDRGILESLAEPLTHLLRNAIVHGIESPAQREAAGKSPRGRVELRALPRGSTVEIVVSDDGRGVSPEAIEDARREGSLEDLLTGAGYSTAEQVTDLAGRGVGLDAVKAYVRSVGGVLEIRSEPGQGLDVVLLLPLALALAEVLLLERGGEVYGIPMASVEEVVIVSETVMLQGRTALELRGRSLPVHDFAALIGLDAPPLPPEPPGVMVSSAGRRAIAACDALLGTEEVVVKPLGPLLAQVEGYLGASILGDGRIALLVESTMLTRVPSGVSSSRPPVPDAVSHAAGPKVLVVEDSFTVRELQRSILEAAGYPVVTARDGRDALSALDRDNAISLVITDLEMPVLDGLELTRAIRADAGRSSLPVVIVTSRGAEEDRRSGIEAGADAYMAKRSFDQQALLATVERLVGR